LNTVLSSLVRRPNEQQRLITVGESAPTPQVESLAPDDAEYREHREEIVTSGVKASISAAKALHEIHSYKDGILWKSDFTSFEKYCSAKWGYAKAHSYRLLQSGGFMAELGGSESPNGDCLPVNEGQVRPLLAFVPKEHRVACWNTIVADKVSAELTGKTVAAEARKFVKEHGLDAKSQNVDKPTHHARHSSKSTSSAMCCANSLLNLLHSRYSSSLVPGKRSSGSTAHSRVDGGSPSINRIPSPVSAFHISVFSVRS